MSGSHRHSISPVGSTRTAKKSAAMSSSRYPTAMRMVSWAAPNYGKQNGPSPPVREQLDGSEM